MRRELAAAAAFLVMMAACGAGPSVGPTGSAAAGAASSSPAGTAMATPSDAPTPSLTPELRPDDIIEVLVTNLVMRSAPTVAASSEIYDERLGVGDRAFVIDGPVSADGYTWYQVARPHRDALRPYGWIAAGSLEGDVWIARADLDCPAAVTADVLFKMSGEEALHCFGSTALAFEVRAPPGPEFCFHSDPILTTEPWLSNVACGINNAGEPDEWGGIYYHLAPELDQSGLHYEGSWRITGHFDDPRSTTCRDNRLDLPGPHEPPLLPTELVVHSCRTGFVVTSIDEG